jgi:predicted transcriptional regulator
MTEAPTKDLLGLTAEIVAAHVVNNSVSMNDIGGLITRVYATLSRLGTAATPAAAIGKREPAVPIKKSVTAEYLICLDDGKKLKMLKRHLQTSYGMTPAQYREKWGLPHDYPMVAPNYAARRSELAKLIGLGTGRRKLVAPPAKGKKGGKQAGSLTSSWRGKGT